MLLRDLLAETELGLTLLTGADRLDRPVRGLYITDLLDPRRYLHGDELVLSGLAWHDGPEDTERFVAAIAEVGVAALATGTARLGDTPADLVEACRRHGIPVLQVPVSVSFNTLAERVRRAISGRELVSAVASGADLAGVLAMAADTFGDGCWVISPAGWASADIEQRKSLVRHFLEADELPGTVDTSIGAFVLWPVESGTRPPAARWFLAIRGDQRRWGEEQQAVAAELATAVALLQARIDQAREIVGRPVEATLRRVRAGIAGEPEIVARLEAAGLPPDEPMRVAALTLGDPDSSVALLREMAAATGVASVTVPSHEGAAAVFADTADCLGGLDYHFRDIVAAVEPGLRGRKLAVGLSRVGSVLRGALKEARHALRLAAARAGNAEVVAGAELASHRMLLAAVPDDLRESYRRRLLEVLHAYDRTHRSDLVHTLETFLECAGSWSRCAQRLHLHVNTLRYRIRRVEEITDRDLTNFDTRVDFYLALEMDRRPFPPVSER